MLIDSLTCSMVMFTCKPGKREAARAIHNCAFVLEDGLYGQPEMVYVATDGHRLTIVRRRGKVWREGWKYPTGETVQVPRVLVAEWKRHLAGGVAQVEIEHQRAVINGLVQTWPEPDRYPPYKDVIPQIPDEPAQWLGGDACEPFLRALKTGYATRDVRGAQVSIQGAALVLVTHTVPNIGSQDLVAKLQGCLIDEEWHKGRERVKELARKGEY